MASYLFQIGGAAMVTEILTSQVDGNRTIFTVSQSFKANSLGVFYNGSRQTGQFTVIDNTTFQLNFVPTLGTQLEVEFVPI